MRLRKLLIGSTAVLFAGGVASTAQAADPAGLVVTSMANYVEQCNNGNGWTKGDWCITLSGGVKFTTEYGTELDFGDSPWDTVVEDVGDDGPWSGFYLANNDLDLSVVATRPTDHGDLTIRIPVLGNAVTTEITIGPWRFRANGVRYQQTFGPAQVTVTVQNPGTLGWTDPRGGGFNQSGPWPDAQFELGFDAGFADLDFGVNVGQRGTDWNPSYFVTVGGYAQAEADIGIGDLTLRFDFDKVNPDGGGLNTVWAYGVRADLELEFGNFTLNPAIGWSRNYGYDYSDHWNYEYDDNEEGNYLFAYLGLEYDVSDMIEVGANVAYVQGPDRPEDRILTLGGEVTFTPASASPLEIGFEVEHQRQLGVMNTDAATNFKVTVGATF